MNRIAPCILVSWALAAAGVSAAPDTLKFTHQSHVQDVGAQCVDCHANILGKTTAGASRRVTEATCKKCHDNQTASFECSVCHTNASRAKSSRATRRELIFSHQEHARHAGDCAACHKGIETETKSGGAKLPSMDICMSCHNNRTAPSSCEACHRDLEKIKPATHDSQWLGRGGHGYQARFPASDCAKCHSESKCVQCHQGNSSRTIHSPGYAFEHGLDVKTKAMDCSVCHETSRSCARCHEDKR